MMEAFQSALPEIILGILTAIAIPLGTLIGKPIKKQIDKIEDVRMQQLAYMGVRWASEQLGRGTGTGLAKHELVKKMILDKFPNVNAEDIDKLIKSTVNAVRDEVGNGGNLPIK